MLLTWFTSLINLLDLLMCKRFKLFVDVSAISGNSIACSKNHKSIFFPFVFQAHRHMRLVMLSSFPFSIITYIQTLVIYCVPLHNYSCIIINVMTKIYLYYYYYIIKLYLLICSITYLAINIVLCHSIS